MYFSTQKSLENFDAASQKTSCIYSVLLIWKGVDTLDAACGASVLLRKRKESRRESRPDSVWWGMVDSNHRRHSQQIYSLSPLATREIPHIN